MPNSAAHSPVGSSDLGSLLAKGRRLGTSAGMFIHLSVNAARSSRTVWGDTQFAEGLIRAIRLFPDCDGELLFRGEIPKRRNEPEVVLRLLGPHLEEPLPGLTNMLWMISPPNLAPASMLQRYQAIFCGASALTERLRRNGVAAEYLPQATETEHFSPDRRPADTPEIDLVFVGGYDPRVDRWPVLEAVRAGYQPHIWGPGWDGVVPDRLWKGRRLDYGQLAEVYASARVVLNTHMADMAVMGFMSNRSFDALACGALVVSDHVTGFAEPGLPEIRQVHDPAGLIDALQSILAARPLDLAARRALHDRVAAHHSFKARAEVIVQTARRLLAQGRVACAAFSLNRARDVAPPRLTDPAASARQVLPAMRDAAEEILQICRYLEQPDMPCLPDPMPAPQQGVIHPLMADLREAQQIARDGCRTKHAKLEHLAARARRISEALSQPNVAQTGFLWWPNHVDQRLARILRNEPLWPHIPDGFHRDDAKVSLRLWPRRQAAASARPVGVFLHLHHDDLAPVFADRLQHLECPFRLYVSTDTETKAERIRTSLPMAEIRVLENRGRDIWPKFYGFGSAHDSHDVVLHLHGKKSAHSHKLDEWLSHNLDCLIGSPGEVSRILSLFDRIPRLGMVAPLVFRNVLGAAHWGANYDIARELAWRMRLPVALPDDNDLRFPVGSMFWALTAAIRPLLDLRLAPAHFPPEAGQVDGTLAHAIERMLGVTCQAAGYHFLPVVGARTRLHVKYQKQFRSNGALRDALEDGAFYA